MSEGFAVIDIIFFAMVAAFIALRLRSVLGRRTGHERRRSGGFGETRSRAPDNVVALPDRSGAPDEADPKIADMADSALKSGLTKIHLADRRFDLEQFLAGAKTAFEMIVEAYAAGNKDALRPLLADDVFAGFANAIDERQAASQSLETQLLAIHKAEPIDADLRNNFARIVVRFDSEQINVMRDADGQVLEGDPNSTEHVVDIWTFERDTRTDDPNWLLIETRTPN